MSDSSASVPSRRPAGAGTVVLLALAVVGLAGIAVARTSHRQRAP